MKEHPGEPKGAAQAIGARTSYGRQYSICQNRAGLNDKDPPFPRSSPKVPSSESGGSSDTPARTVPAGGVRGAERNCELSNNLLYRGTRFANCETRHPVGCQRGNLEKTGIDFTVYGAHRPRQIR